MWRWEFTRSVLGGARKLCAVALQPRGTSLANMFSIGICCTSCLPRRLASFTASSLIARRYLVERPEPYVMVFGGTDVNEHSKEEEKRELMLRVLEKARVIVAFNPGMLARAESVRWTAPLSTQTDVPLRSGHQRYGKKHN